MAPPLASSQPQAPPPMMAPEPAQPQAPAPNESAEPATSSIATEPDIAVTEVSSESHWGMTQDPEGRVYYWNKQTGAVTWEKPEGEIIDSDSEDLSQEPDKQEERLTKEREEIEAAQVEAARREEAIRRDDEARKEVEAEAARKEAEAEVARAEAETARKAEEAEAARKAEEARQEEARREAEAAEETRQEEARREAEAVEEARREAVAEEARQEEARREAVAEEARREEARREAEASEAAELARKEEESRQQAARELADEVERAALTVEQAAQQARTLSEQETLSAAAQDLGPWIEVKDGNGNIYYWNEDTDETTWEKPAQFVESITKAEIAEEALRKVAESEVATTQPVAEFVEQSQEVAREEPVKTVQNVIEFVEGLLDSKPAVAAPNTAAAEERDEEGKSLMRDLVPLSNIVDNWLLVNGMLEEHMAEDLEGPVHALSAALSLLKDLWFLDDQSWLRMRDRVKIGLVKDTKLYGNTSVSMGAAKLFGKPGTHVAFLNCGTGGIKYQLYSWEGTLRLVAEFKPKNGASVQTLQVGNYKPATPLSLDAAREALLQELASEKLPWAAMPHIAVFAFVTGTMRNHWEEADREEKGLLDAEVQRLFQGTGVGCLSGTYFLSSAEEGRLELVGCAAMYENLTAAGLLAPGTKIIGSFGIGRGSCQWAIAKGDEVETIGHSSGMSDLKGLHGVGYTVMSAYSNPDHRETLLASIANVEAPVIALKSGCCLLIERKEFSQIKEQLTAPAAPQPLRKARVIQNGSTKPETIFWMGSFGRFCAEAAAQLKLAGDYPVVYGSDGRRISSVEQLEGSELLALAPMREEWIPQKVAPKSREAPAPPPWDDGLLNNFNLEAGSSGPDLGSEPSLNLS